MPAFPRVSEVIQTIFSWLNILTRNDMDLQARVKVLEDMLVKLEEENKILRSMAEHDHLTGLKNRRWFEAMCAKVRARAERHGTPFCICVIDVDHFKSINDQYGHKGGDTVLNHLATVLSRMVRESDYVARWGGEEFVILLDETSQEHGFQSVERIRAYLHETVIRVDGTPIRVTVSIGVSQWVVGKNMSTLISEADVALYRAKNSGRNKVCTFTEE